MGARLQIQPHLKVEEVEAHYRGAKTGLERTHWQVIRLLLLGERSEEVARVVGYSVLWVRTLAKRYNSAGPEALADGRRNNPGKAPLLDAAALEALRQALEDPPQEGGLWSGPKAARWMERRLGRAVDNSRGREALLRMGWTPQRPRPRHREADPEEQRRFQGRGAAAGLRSRTTGASQQRH